MRVKVVVRHPGRFGAAFMLSQGNRELTHLTVAGAKSLRDDLEVALAEHARLLALRETPKN